MELFNIVAGGSSISELRKSQYFKLNLGSSSTKEVNQQRILSDRDKFAYLYNSQYKTTILMQGNIGNITIYIDYYITNNDILIYKNMDGFLYTYDPNIVMEKGIDFFIGHIIKKMNEDIEESQLQKDRELEILENKGSSDKLINNPGAVSYDDLKAYLKNKEANRLKGWN